jgi:dTDP-4-dehydrorhamnose 3,5-epimerase
MEFSPLAIPEVLVVQPRLIADARGFFFESYRKAEFAARGLEASFVQHNHSGSGKGCLRGLHYQIRQPQGKLIRLIAGEAYDVAVDLRRSSPTFRRWVGVALSSKKRNQLWVPQGFAHGFYVLSDWAEVLYQTTDYYAPQWERSLLWNDPALGIEWPIPDGQQPLLSEKDRRAAPLSEAEVFD